MKGDYTCSQTIRFDIVLYSKFSKRICVHQRSIYYPPRMNPTQQTTTMEQTQQKKTKAPKAPKAPPKKLTFTRTIQFFVELTKEDVMERVYGGADELTEEQKEKVWEALVARSYNGIVDVGDDYEEEDVEGSWVDGYVEDEIDEVVEEVKKEEKGE